MTNRVDPMGDTTRQTEQRRGGVYGATTAGSGRAVSRRTTGAVPGKAAVPSEGQIQVRVNSIRARERQLATRSIDVLCLVLAWSSAFVISTMTSVEVRSDRNSLLLVLITVGSTLAFFERRSLYQSRPALPRTDEISRLLGSIVAGAAVTVVAVAFLDWRIGATELLFGGFAASGILIVARGMIRSLGAELEGRHVPQPVVIVGTGQEARELAEVIVDHPESRFRLVGVVGHLPVAEEHGLASLWLGPTSRLVEVMHIHETNAAIVTPTGFRGQQFRSITKSLFDAGFDVHLSTGVSRLWDGRFDVRSLSHEPLIVMSTNETASWQRLAKRLLDVVGAIVVLILAAPFMLLTAMAIKVEDGGSVFFRQPRAGRNVELFGMMKFRSMVPDAEALKSELQDENERSGPLFKLSDDPRITTVGRFIRETSIDELPQLFNVLRGEMSLVGPRPALVEEEEVFDDELRGRFDVRPGITGLWQVEARSNASFGAYRRLDLHYVENWTLGLDLRILMATAEQLIVSVVMLPVRRLLRSPSPDQIVNQASNTIIDLRERTTARLIAAHGSGSAEETSTGVS